MAKDFAARRQAPVQHSRIPKWVWLLSLLLIAAFIYALFRLSQVEIPDSKSNAPASTVISSKELPKPIAAPKAIKPTSLPTTTASIKDKIEGTQQQLQQAQEVLQFYEQLSQQEVEVPKAEALDYQAIESQRKKYILQVASFKQQQDADRLRAQLILSNINDPLPFIEKITRKDNVDIYRVMVGPMTSSNKINKIASQLADMGLNPLKKQYLR